MAVDNTHFKGCWRPEEDEALRKAVAMHGEKNWSVVARHFNTLMGRSPLLGRAPKQCRSRYLQQLVPGIKTGEWTAEEEEVLVEGHRQFGNQWTLIASMLPGRTETSVKNHYNCTARRKVPSDLSRMTILQRYLASIGVISLNTGGKGGKGFPSLGSGYPSSSSSQFFHNHAAPMTTPSNRAGHNTGGSPSVSHHYEDYSDDAARMQHMALAYQQHAGEEEDEQQQQYEQYEQYEQFQQYQQQQPQPVSDEQCTDEADNAEGAAAGLLQLARAALMHLEEEEEEEGTGSHQHNKEQDEAMGSGDEQPLEARSRHQSMHRQNTDSRPPGMMGLFVKSELAMRSNSEESAHTAEDEEGSPMAEANLKLQLQQNKPSSSLMGKRIPLGSEQLLAGPTGSKRQRSMWEPSMMNSAAGPTVASLSRLSRPVLDVSEPHFAAPSTVAADASSPASPPLAVSSKGTSPAAAPGQQTDAQAQLLALMMQAFMGAAATEGATSATALSPNRLAAVARVMALSGLALGGQGYPAPATATGQPAVAAGAMAELLAALAQQERVPAGSFASAWSASSPEQQLRAAVGQ